MRLLVALLACLAFGPQPTGRGVTVYVFDGGIVATSPEIAGRVRPGFEAFPGDSAVCNGHGTAVAAAIAGRTLGEAPGAELVDVKVIQCARLHGTIQSVVQGAHWVLADRAAHPGPAVANWSFMIDTTRRVPEIDDAVAELLAAGIPVVVSAGNVDLDACLISPANAPGVIVAGAALPSGGPAPGTAHGPCVTVYAPGDDVRLPGLDATLLPWNGTSMAAGFASGAAALFLEAHAGATPFRVAAELRKAGTLPLPRRSP
jgi:subtilisin family serine protease